MRLFLPLGGNAGPLCLAGINPRTRLFPFRLPGSPLGRNLPLSTQTLADARFSRRRLFPTLVFTDVWRWLPILSLVTREHGNLPDL